MPFTVEINGVDVEFEREPTEEDIDDAASQLGLQSQQGFTPAQFPEEPTKQDLGLSFLGKAALRGKLAFGEDPSQIKPFLQQRFPGRNIKRLEGRKFAIDGIPIDPGEFSVPEAVLDIVDISDEIVRLGGQLLGGAKGAAIGTAAAPGVGTGIGLVAGGAAGRATGQAAVESIGRFFGVQGGEGIADVAKDIAKEGAIGAAGEALGLGIRGTSKASIKFLKRFWKQVARKGRAGEQIALNFTGGMPREAIAEFQRRGPEIFTKENLADDALLRLGRKIQTAASETRKKLGQAVKSGKGIIRGKAISNIDITDIKGEFSNSLRDIDLLNSKFEPLRPIVGKLSKGQKEVMSIFNFIRGKSKISPNVALRLRGKIDDLVEFGRPGERLVSSREESVLKSLRKGLKNKLIDVSDDFAKANKDFEIFAAIDDSLAGKLDLTRVENFLKTTFSGQHIFEEGLQKLNRAVGVDKTFMRELRGVLAARAFEKTTFAGIRSGIFTGLLTSLGFPSGPLGSLAGFTAGATLSTPRAAGQALLGRQAAFRTLRALAGRAGQARQAIEPKAAASLLSNLLNRQ